MSNPINTKLLLIVIALLASIASFCAYEKHKEQAAERQAQEIFRPPPNADAGAISGLAKWSKKAREYRPK